MRATLAAGAALASMVIGGSPAMAQTDRDWTGLSVGILGGGLQTKDRSGERLVFDRDFDGQFDDAVVTVPGADAFSPGFCGGSANGAQAAQGCDDDKEGVEAALRVGYDQQFGSFVVGALAEVSTSTAEDSVTGFSTTPAYYTFKRNLQGMVAARLRAGYAIGPALLYGTGGYAMGRIDNRFTTSNTVNAFSTTNDDETDADGWQAGGGVEWRLAPRLSATAEYLYTSLDVDDPFVVRVSRGGAPATNPFILPLNTAGTDIARTAEEFRVHAVRIGMAYRF
ncbi:outer membrane protein [Brevundimonas sp. PAMC22021]|uniref:outer membrane protein n=1 Tax=Brevundimonas sp. PAMC22021 TaxID=2861285 RepID=UPI001C624FB3|nr:outer membrane beta-barrel protein [Brevundimonas sp. PAMC22021]QYF85944.1 outer membrane beta-barrel protein [Brevundimonas sp. PAMC22021]